MSYHMSHYCNLCNPPPPPSPLPNPAEPNTCANYIWNRTHLGSRNKTKPSALSGRPPSAIIYTSNAPRSLNPLWANERPTWCITYMYPMRAKFNIYADLYRRCCYKNITVWRVVENKYSYSYSYS
jgi:hypothetical protein